MKRNLKRNIVIAAVLVFVGAAVYLNWSYNARWGTASAAMAKAEDEAMAAAGEEYLAVSASAGDAVSAYFAQARLTRQQSRDEAMQMLETACAGADASQDVIDEAMRRINTMAQWSMAESVMETELLAREFADCVVFAGDEAITVAVPAPQEGLDEAAVAQITQTVLANSDYEASQLNILEIKN